MKVTIQNSNDFFAGLIFIFFGTVISLVSRNYSMGTAVRMDNVFIERLWKSVKYEEVFLKA